MSMTLELAELSGSREAARELVAELTTEHDVRGAVVLVDASRAASTPPSFVDELCKALLLDSEVATVEFLNASERLQFLASRSAGIRDVSARIRFATAV